MALAVAGLLVLPLLPLIVCSTASADPPRDSRVENTDTMVMDLVTYDRQMGDISSRIDELHGKSSSLTARIEEIENIIASNRKNVRRKREAFSKRARNIYVNGRVSKLDLLLSSSDLSEFLKRSEMLKKVNDNDSSLIRSIEDEQEKLDSSLDLLKRRKREIADLTAKLTSEKNNLTRSREKREGLISRAGDSAGEIQQQSDQVSSKMDEINPPPTGKHTGRFLTMKATAYSPKEPGLSDHTATGLKAQRGVVAVDPGVIPLGTRLHVEGYGYAIAADTGSAIKGNRIDLCFDTLDEVLSFGWKTVTVEILE